jgi:hypothetical protein
MSGSAGALASNLFCGRIHYRRSQWFASAVYPYTTFFAERRIFPNRAQGYFFRAAVQLQCVAR